MTKRISKKKSCSSLKRDLLFLAATGMIVLINFVSLHSRHYRQIMTSSTSLSETTSALQKRLEFSVVPAVGALEENRAKQQDHSRGLGLLDFDFIRSHLLIEAPWAESHGSDHNHYLGAGLLYYSFAYAFQCRTVVVLGSGGGFVPRLLRQAQRDLKRSRLDGYRKEDEISDFQLILIDAHMPSAGWGATFYAENEETVMRRDFSDIRYIFKTTDDAFEILKSEGIEIDYLHVDADHSFEQSYRDFTNYVSLLSPRGIVSFHDTCQNATRHCETGVPDSLREIQKQPDAFGLQFLDAHYLYRGIAFAIQREAPALNQPKLDRWNFCHNNAASLIKSSNGFDNNGKLSSLGDFYDCANKYNVTQLGQPCPKGFRRSQITKDLCLKCIPGLKGQDCSSFRYADRRAKELPYETDVDLLQRQKLIAAWLADYDIQHLFEINSIPTSSQRLYHPIQSAVAADPRMQIPLWSDDDEVPILRHLPIRYKDVLKDGDYAATVHLEHTDAIVCVDCQRDLKDAAELPALLDEFPRLRVLILESHIKTNFLAEATKLLQPVWNVEADVVVGSARLERKYPHNSDIVRHLMLFTRKIPHSKIS